MIAWRQFVGRETLVAAIVVGLIVVGGGRLIGFGSEARAREARATAAAVAARQRISIERSLAALADRARQHASNPLGPVSPADRALIASANGRIVEGDATQAAFAEEILTLARRANQRTPPAPQPGIVGPVRADGRWRVVALAPLGEAAMGAAAPAAAWVIMYRDLGQLLAESRLGELATAGYDFELTAWDPATARWHAFFGPAGATLDDAVDTVVRLPADDTAGAQPAGWTLRLRPKAGWSPANRLVADVVLLIVVAWLSAMAAYDYARSVGRLRGALGRARLHQQSLQRRLVGEIASREELQRSLEHSRYHDQFTGLPNRRYLMDQLERGLRTARTRQRYAIGIILVSIDRFRLVTDTLGQNAGDELMVQVARRLETTPAATERVISRWGRDQFAVLLFDVNSIDTAMSVARLMQSALQETFELRRFRLRAAARMGVTCVHSGLHRAEDVLREADIALSVAVDQGGSPIVPFVAGMRHDAAHLVHLEADLHAALERREFRLLFQPIVELRTRRMVGAEALLRWQHPLQGPLRPAAFLATAEEAGLTVPITRWLLTQACSTVAEWRQRLPRATDFFISANLSPDALRDPGFADGVSDLLTQAQVPAECLRLELREDALINGLGGAHDMLDSLKRKGIGLMLDDFGTGFSSLAYLQHCPFDYVKIDRSLVSDVNPSGPHGSVVSAMVQFATTLGLKTIAEAVESENAASRLQRIGCEFGQGYLFGEPVPAEQVLTRIYGQVSSAGTA
jgi:diguanylate cyclase (GGDEF)-like protein